MSENVNSSPTSSDLIRTYGRLGLTSFGGPVAHIGYYRDAFIAKTGWMDDEAFAERLALCQALPGPTSSQMAFACAWKMSGSLGMAFLCLSLFLIPSVVILLALGLFFVASAGGRLGGGLLQSFMAHLADWMTPLVVAVISYAAIGMFKSLSFGLTRRWITVLSFVMILALMGVDRRPEGDLGPLRTVINIVPIIFGALMGLAFLRSKDSAATPAPSSDANARGEGRSMVWLCILAFFALLAVSLVIILFELGPFPVQLLAGFYEAGSLVFGGGHVVLPLLNDVLVEPDLVPESAFRTGYGFAQAIPGPVFAVAAFLGGQVGGLSGLVLGILGTIAIFLPGVLLVMAVMPLSASYAQNRAYKAALAGVNAAVVGLLGATAFSLFFLLRTPGILIQQADDTTAYIAAALLGLFFLWVLRLPPLILIAMTLVAALLTTLL